MARADYAEAFVRGSAARVGRELALAVQVTRDHAADRWLVTCKDRRAYADNYDDPARVALELENAVEVVMGLREPAKEGGAG